MLFRKQPGDARLRIRRRPLGFGDARWGAATGCTVYNEAEFDMALNRTFIPKITVFAQKSASRREIGYGIWQTFYAPTIKYTIAEERGKEPERH